MVHSQGFRFTGFSTPGEHVLFFFQLWLESNPHWGGFAVISRTVFPSTFAAATCSVLPWRLEFDVSFELTAFQSAKPSRCIYFQWQPNRPNLAYKFSASQCLTEAILSCRPRFQVSLTSQPEPPTLRGRFEWCGGPCILLKRTVWILKLEVLLFWVTQWFARVLSR